MNYQSSNIRSETAPRIDGAPIGLDGEPATKGTGRLWLWIGIAILLAGIIGAAYYLVSSAEGGATPAGDRDEQAPRVSVIAPGRERARIALSK